MISKLPMLDLIPSPHPSELWEEENALGLEFLLNSSLGVHRVILTENKIFLLKIKDFRARDSHDKDKRVSKTKLGPLPLNRSTFA